MQAYRKAKPKQGHNRIVALRGSKPPQSMSGFSMDPQPATRRCSRRQTHTVDRPDTPSTRASNRGSKTLWTIFEHRGKSSTNENFGHFCHLSEYFFRTQQILDEILSRRESRHLVRILLSDAVYPPMQARGGGGEYRREGKPFV